MTPNPTAATKTSCLIWWLQLCGWGALWGVMLGFSLMASYILRAHHLYPQTLSQWLIVDAALAITFAAVGAAFSVTAMAVAPRPFRAATRSVPDRTWTLGLVAGPVVIVSYTIVATILYWMADRSFALVVAKAYWPVIATSGLGFLGLLLILRLTNRLAPSNAAMLAAILGLVAVVLGVILPIELRGAPASQRPERLVAMARTHSPAPLLFVGIDSGTWRIIDPLIQRGERPAFRKLLARGVRGNMQAAWPPHWSAAAWAAITTGYSREETGICEDLATTARGLPMFQFPFVTDFWLNPLFGIRRTLVNTGIVRIEYPPRALLRRTPFWELLSQAAAKTAVLRLGFAFAAEDRADYVVAKRTGHSTFEGMGVRNETSARLLADLGEDHDLFSIYTDPRPIDERLFSEVATGPGCCKPTDVGDDPSDGLRMVMDLDARTFSVCETLISRHPELQVTGLYLDGFELVCHRFWPYRFPGDQAPPSKADVERLGPIVDRYMAFIDRRLALLIAAFPETPNVIVVSDHAAGPSGPGAPREGWHAAPAIFIGAGPDIPHHSDSIDVSYMDVVPTILGLEGFRRPAGLRG